ncbi:type II secretion system protein N [Corallincola spongiicola]|uniref:Type II secretion system protein N n=1 Tax=Corallincola spongiicola TaxID=2520508 RepID=A0ABY1WQ66_9GAMM|nr:type II secretion system protein N [Corallincola spongiicola]TAA46078.1 type II secretion system protein N [Corallincola spongiicola]
MIWLRRGIIAGCLYLVFLIATLPAALLVNWLPLPDDVVLQGVSGTVWKGDVAVVRERRIVLEKVRWDLSPWPLLLGQVKANVQFGDRNSEINGRVDLVAETSGISIYNGYLEVPGKFVDSLANLPGGSRLDGRFRYAIDRFEHGLPWCESLKGDIYWEEAMFSNRLLKNPALLGLFHVTLSCVDGQVVGVIDGSQSPLNLTGELKLPDRERAVGSLLMQPDRTLPKDLREGLEFLSDKTPEGLKIEFDTKLAL